MTTETPTLIPATTVEGGPPKVEISIFDCDEKKMRLYTIERVAAVRTVTKGLGLVEFSYKEPVFARLRRIEKDILSLYEAGLLQAQLHFYRLKTKDGKVSIELRQVRTMKHFICQSPLTSAAALRFQLGDNGEPPAELERMLTDLETVLNDGEKLKIENKLNSLGGCLLRWIEQGAVYLAKYMHADLSPANIGKRNLKIFRTISMIVTMGLAILPIVLV